MTARWTRTRVVREWTDLSRVVRATEVTAQEAEVLRGMMVSFSGWTREEMETAVAEDEAGLADLVAALETRLYKADRLGASREAIFSNFLAHGLPLVRIFQIDQAVRQWT